ncbi:MAG: hypothetical protein JWN34_4860 [Bryobacterales bacterium]|nr:hypothetical protein [Bryobacterales bacterium]
MAFLQPVTFSADVDCCRVMQQPVQNRSGDDRVAQHRSPFSVALVRGEDDAAALVTGTDQLKEDGRGQIVKRQLAHLVDDENLWRDGSLSRRAPQPDEFCPHLVGPAESRWRLHARAAVCAVHESAVRRSRAESRSRTDRTSSHTASARAAGASSHTAICARRLRRSHFEQEGGIRGFFLKAASRRASSRASIAVRFIAASVVRRPSIAVTARLRRTSLQSRKTEFQMIQPRSSVPVQSVLMRSYRISCGTAPPSPPEPACRAVSRTDEPQRQELLRVAAEASPSGSYNCRRSYVPAVRATVPAHSIRLPGGARSGTPYRLQLARCRRSQSVCRPIGRLRQDISRLFPGRIRSNE